MNEGAADCDGTVDWNRLAEDVIAGEKLSFEQGLRMLQVPDGQLLDVLAAAFRIRQKYFGMTVQLYFLMND